MSKYGGFWRRTLAYVLDAIILNIGVSIISFVIGIGIGGGMVFANAEASMAGAISGAIGGLLGLIASWLYSAVLESSSYQATFGKLALGLVVTDENGDRISFARATGRYFAKIISAVILMIGFLMVGWTDRKRGLHDMIAGTLVHKSRNPSELVTSVEVFR